MAGAALENEFASCVADDPGDDPERHVTLGENRPLLDVELQKRTRQGPTASHERSAADTSDLLAAERNDRSEARVLDGLDRGNHAERSVEPPPGWDCVQMRSDPDVGRRGRTSDQISVQVHLDVEARLLQPARGELVRLVLGDARMRTIRARPAADRVELLEPLEGAHAGDAPSSRFPI
jgi:hypothetical protein